MSSASIRAHTSDNEYLSQLIDQASIFINCVLDPHRPRIKLLCNRNVRRAWNVVIIEDCKNSTSSKSCLCTILTNIYNFRVGVVNKQSPGQKCIAQISLLVTVATLLVVLATAPKVFVLIMIISTLRGEVCMLIVSLRQEFGFR